MSSRDILLLVCWALASAIGVRNLVRLRRKERHTVRLRREVLAFLVFGLAIPVGVFGRPPHLDLLPFSVAMIVLVGAFFVLLLSARLRSPPEDG
jgi:arginine exporter protein ArgO